MIQRAVRSRKKPAEIPGNIIKAINELHAPPPIQGPSDNDIGNGEGITQHEMLILEQGVNHCGAGAKFFIVRLHDARNAFFFWVKARVFSGAPKIAFHL